MIFRIVSYRIVSYRIVSLNSDVYVLVVKECEYPVYFVL